MFSLIARRGKGAPASRARCDVQIKIYLPERLLSRDMVTLKELDFPQTPKDWESMILFQTILIFLKILLISDFHYWMKIFQQKLIAFSLIKGEKLREIYLNLMKE